MESANRKACCFVGLAAVVLTAYFRYLAKMNTWTTETCNLFESTLAWLNQRACTCTYDFRSKMPWDPSL